MKRILPSICTIFILGVLVVAQTGPTPVTETKPTVDRWEFKAMAVTDVRTTLKGDVAEQLHAESDKASREHEEKMAQAGKEGWELVAVVERFAAQPSISGASTTTRYFLKRRLP